MDPLEIHKEELKELKELSWKMQYEYEVMENVDANANA